MANERVSGLLAMVLATVLVASPLAAKEIGDSPITVQDVLDVCDGYSGTVSTPEGWCRGYLMAVDQLNHGRLMKRPCPPPIVREGAYEADRLAYLRAQPRRRSEPAARLLWEFHQREHPCPRK